MGDYGDKIKYDADFKGPIEKRELRDIPALILYGLFWIGMLVVMGLAFGNGNPDRLVYGTDSNGNICGVDNTGGNLQGGYVFDFTDYPVVYFPDITSTDGEICMAACPTPEEQPEATEILAFKSGASIGWSGKNFQCGYCAVNDDGSQVDSSKCTGIYYDADKLGSERTDLCHYKYQSDDFLHRCVPGLNAVTDDGNASNSDASSVSASAKAQDISQTIFSDVYAAKWRIFGLSVLALVLGFLWIFFLRMFAKIMVWLTLIIFVCVLAAVTFVFFNKYSDAKTTYDNLPEVQQTSEDKNNYKTLQVVAIIFAVITALAVCVIFFMRNRINLAIGIIKEAGRAISAMPLIVFFPIPVFLVMVLFFMYWLFIAAYLATAGDATYDDSGKFISFQANQDLRRAQYYHFFGLLWNVQFLLAFGECVIAGAVSAWYFTLDKTSLPGGQVWKSVKRTARYHLGSIAFGSLIIAIVQFIRAMISAAERQLKGTDNDAAKFLLRCLQCFFYCVEKFLKFINRNAYIQIAVYGYSFCGAAKKAFMLIMRNVLRIGAVNVIGDTLFWLGKMCVTFMTIIVAIEALSAQKELTFYIIPVFVVALLAYGIASSFFAIYEMAVDTVLMAFLIDEETNDGSESKPYFAPASLRSFINSSGSKKEESKDSKEVASEAETDA